MVFYGICMLGNFKLKMLNYVTLIIQMIMFIQRRGVELLLILLQMKLKLKMHFWNVLVQIYVN